MLMSPAMNQVSRPSVIRDHVSHVATNGYSGSPTPTASTVHRNAIAQQLVQQSLHNSQAQLQKMSQQSRAGSVPPSYSGAGPPPPAYTSSQTMTRVPPRNQVTNTVPRTQIQSPYLYKDQTAILNNALTSLQNTRTLSKPDHERTYMNVQPVAVIGKVSF